MMLLYTCGTRYFDKLKHTLQHHSCALLSGENLYNANNLCLGTKFYENKQNCNRFLGADSIPQEIKKEVDLTSANYMNSLFKSAFDYLKILK